MTTPVYTRVKSRLAVIEPHVKGKSVLDIGCVDSRPGGIRKYESTGLHRFLREQSAELLGVDIDAEGAAEMTAQGYDVVAADVETMNLGRRFDCIVAGEVIEHVNNAGLFLESLRAHLKDDGRLILTTPNAFCIVHAARAFRKNRVLVHAEHTCWYDAITLSQLLARYDLEPERIYFANADKWYKPRYLHKIFKYQLPRFISWLRPYLSGTIVAVVRKSSP